MRTYEFNDIPEIEWSVDYSRAAMVDNHGHSTEQPAYGESEDGRKWMATAQVMFGSDDTEIDLDSIEEDKP